MHFLLSIALVLQIISAVVVIVLVLMQHGKGAELSLEFASSMTSVPYHPGAAKYFAEKGFEVATK